MNETLTTTIMNTSIRIILFTIILLLIFKRASAQSTMLCKTEIEENSPSNPIGAIQTAMMKNGDVLIAGFYPVSGVTRFVVQRYNITSCTASAVYYVNYDVAYDSTLQLLVTYDDMIFLKYKGSSYYNIIQLDSNLNQLNLLQVNINGYPELKIGADNEGNLVLTRKKVNSNFNFEVQVQKLGSVNFNLWWVVTLPIANSNILSINDLVMDSVNNIYVTGYLENSAPVKSKAYLVKFNDGGGPEWINTWDQPFSTNKNNLIIDREQNILLASKYYLNREYKLAIHKYSGTGTLLWQKSKSYGSLEFIPVWITTDSNCNIYAASCKSGLTPYITTRLFKFNSAGNQLWVKSIPNLKPAAIKVGYTSEKIAIAGSRYFTHLIDSSYRAYFRSLDASGNFLYDDYDHYSPGSNPANVYYATYNDIELHEDIDKVTVAGKRTYSNYAAGTKNFYIHRNFYLHDPGTPKSANNLETEVTVNIQPNPVSDYLIVSLSEYLPAELEVTDMLGKKIMGVFSESEETTIDVQSLRNGIYFLSIRHNNGYSRSYKFIKTSLDR